MRPVEKTADHRRSRRYASRLDVELAQGSATQRCYSIDVSRHGIFLATERPPRERFLVRVVIQLPDGALFANAFVSRSVPPGTERHEALLNAVLATVNGIAAGMKTTG